MTSPTDTQATFANTDDRNSFGEPEVTKLSGLLNCAHRGTSGRFSLIVSHFERILMPPGVLLSLATEQNIVNCLNKTDKKEVVVGGIVLLFFFCFFFSKRSP